MDREDQLIRELAGSMPSAVGRSAARRSSGGDVRLGIGDDAALIVPRRNADVVVTCDAFLDAVHFLADHHPAQSVGYKSLARATSDIAAMGASPRFFLLTLAVPQGMYHQWLRGFHRGMRRAAIELGVVLIGGDTTRSRSISMSITVLGEAPPGRVVSRAGAQPGDILYVTGGLGRAQLGLELIRRCPVRAVHRMLRRQSALLRQHLYPHIRLQLGAWLAKNRIATAMIDVSDGLSTDLGHLCAASGVGARVWTERIPRVEIPASQARFARRHKLDPLQMALHGGDDYELLFTVSQRQAKLLKSAPEFRDIAAIGEIERGKRIVLVDSHGRERLLKPAGWDPFR
jgi:thiamine-monophosphate kinase